VIISREEPESVDGAIAKILDFEDHARGGGARSIAGWRELVGFHATFSLRALPTSKQERISTRFHRFDRCVATGQHASARTRQLPWPVLGIFTKEEQVNQRDHHEHGRAKHEQCQSGSQRERLFIKEKEEVEVL
jgi:hypothetical protein